MAHAVSITHTADAANRVEWAKLALVTPRAHVLRVTRIRYDATDRPLALEEVVLPLDRFPGLSPNGDDVPDIVQLAQQYGLSLGRATERVSIVRSHKDAALHLGIAEGTDVLKLDRIVETANGEPIEWRVVFCKSTN